MILPGELTHLHNTGIPSIGADRAATWNTESTVTIEDGATWSVQGRLFVRRTGSIEVDNGSLLVNTGEGTTDSRIHGNITLSNGALLEQKSTGSVANGFQLTGTDRVILRIQSQSSATMGSALDVRNAEVIVHGTGTTLDVGERFLLAGDGTTTGNISIEAGGVARAQTLWIGSTSGTPVGIVDVTGAGSELQVNTYIFVGGIEAGARAPGRLRVADGGKVTAEPSRQGILVWGPGTLDMDDGAVHAGLLDFKPDATFEVTLHTGKTGAPVQVFQTGSSTFNRGDVILTDAVFNLSLAEGFTSALEEEFTLIRLEGTRTGMFSGLGEGTVLTAFEPSLGTKYEFEISYAGGTGQDVILTVIPEPATLGLLDVAAMMMALRHKRAPAPWRQRGN